MFQTFDIGRIMRGILLVTLLGFIQSVALAQDIQRLFNALQGTFVTTERPEDYKAVLVWKQTSQALPELGNLVLLHERATIRTIDKPYNQQYWVLKNTDTGIMLHHYEKQLSSSDLITPLPYMDMPLQFENGVWIGSVEFVNPAYLSRFVESGHRAKVKLQFKTDEILYHLMVFDSFGKQVYGPKEKGYVLKKK